MEKLVPWVGRKVLTKATAQAIPTYAMSAFKFSKLSIQAAINWFWWSHKCWKKMNDGCWKDREMNCVVVRTTDLKA